ncbi:MAG: SigF/SigG family RNA polymerase sporulation sigma factor [Lachnospiraceae bacterium]|nr:SigF/SigG family RNA polymerase sporulation sigma factor [Lachnospiraceae bacterium]
MADNIELIEIAHAGDKKARDRLVEDNIGLVWSVVKRFSGRGIDMEDLFQIGCIGLLKAIDKFDTGFNVRFSTYAVPMISGELKRFLRDDGMVKVSRTLKENYWKIKAAMEKLGHDIGREATIAELSEETGLATEDIVMAMEANIEVESIYQMVFQGDGSEIYLVDRIAGDTASTLGADKWQKDNEKEKLLDHIVLEQAISELSATEEQLIRMRYYEDKTQTEVADVLGISQVQVSRLEKKLLKRMREKIGPR